MDDDYIYGENMMRDDVWPVGQRNASDPPEGSKRITHLCHREEYRERKSNGLSFHEGKKGLVGSEGLEMCVDRARRKKKMYQFLHMNDIPIYVCMIQSLREKRKRARGETIQRVKAIHHKANREDLLTVIL